MSSHMIRGRQLSRDTEHRLAMRRNLVQSLFEHGKVKTTLPKALEVKSFAEKMITLPARDRCWLGGR
jgi:large subunit ribosomal protein L17